MVGAEMFGLVDHEGATPVVQFLEQPVPVTPELLQLAEPLRPTEVFRFAAPCQGDRCSHWDGAECKLVDQIVELLPVASLTLPPCKVRIDCRWFAQRGRQACQRCPQVVTQNEEPSEEMRAAAEPRPGA